MTRSALLFATLLFVFATRLFAQSPNPSPEQLKSWIAIRQQRVDLLQDEIKQMDAHLESRLDVIVDTLKSITDSKDSRTKIARMKEDTGKRLMKSIEYYDQKRAAQRQELRQPQNALTAADREKLIAAFDEKIDERTQQILALNKSMPAPKEYERYTATGGGWYGTQYERNLDYEQNRRMTSHSNTQRDALVKELDASVARLDRLSRTLREQLEATTDPAARKEREAEIAKNDALIAERKKQRREILQPIPEAARREVASKEATDLDQAMKRSVQELQRDFTTLFQRYHTYVAELSALRQTEAALTAAERK